LKMLRKIGVLALILVLSISLVGCSSNTASDNTIVIAGKNFTEQDILVYLMADIIEAKTDLKVETKPYLGGTLVVAQALDRGDVDIYPEYTGTALVTILEEPSMNDSQAVYDLVKQRYQAEKDLVWLEPFGFNNTYTLAMRESQANELGIETFSDLQKHAPDLTLGATQEFLERDDGYKGLQEVYNMNFKETKGMDPGLTYAAVKDGATDVNDAFSTDGRIVAFDLKVLKDDKNFFPPYYAAPVVRQDTLDAHPEIADALNLLAGKIDDTTMSELNAKVDLEKQNPKDVAHDWLIAEGLI